MEKEHCSICDEATGRAGIHEDSLYDDDGNGPYCENCWDKLTKEKKFEDFYSSVGCLLAEGVEFMSRSEVYEAIKKEWRKVNINLLEDK